MIKKTLVPSKGDVNHGVMASVPSECPHNSFNNARLVLVPSHSKARTENPNCVNASIVRTTMEWRKHVSTVDGHVK